jgi:hypothetical protein
MLPTINWQSRSQKRRIPFRHCDFTEAGQMTSTFDMPASRTSSSDTPMAWMVLFVSTAKQMTALRSTAASVQLLQIRLALTQVRH